jgi:hypothetical protein
MNEEQLTAIRARYMQGTETHVASSRPRCSRTSISASPSSILLTNNISLRVWYITLKFDTIG